MLVLQMLKYVGEKGAYIQIAIQLAWFEADVSVVYSHVEAQLQAKSSIVNC